MREIEDVRWYEAGNPQVIEGRSAVLARFASMPGDAPPAIDIVAAVADDDHLFVEGTAQFARGDQTLSYRFAERYTMRDGVVTERRAYMDAVPPDVAAFFAGQG
jgi:ketosteroid isomerase-like protein